MEINFLRSKAKVPDRPRPPELLEIHFADGFTPRPSDWEPPSREVVVAVFGTGVDLDHPGLEGRVVAGASFCEGPWHQDDHGFGTMVAGVCAGDQPVDDWRVDQAKALHDGRYHGLAFIELRQQTLDLPPAEVAAYRAKLERAQQISDSPLALTGQMRQHMRQGLPLEAAYQQALRAEAGVDSPPTTLRLETNSDYVTIGATRLEIDL